MQQQATSTAVLSANPGKNLELSSIIPTITVTVGTDFFIY